jgi:hypothetical protein
MDSNNGIKVSFAPGCFDDFEGTQEELDELVKLITETIESSSMEELEEVSEPLEEQWDDLNDDTRESIMKSLDLLIELKNNKSRKLN